VDIALYFIAPHRLRPVDLDFIKRLSKIVPVVRLRAPASKCGLPCVRARRARALAGSSVLTRGAQHIARKFWRCLCLPRISRPCFTVQGMHGKRAVGDRSQNCRRSCHNCPAWWTLLCASLHRADGAPDRALHAAAHGQLTGAGGARRCRCWLRRTA